jgi:hypothetical protein
LEWRVCELTWWQSGMKDAKAGFTVEDIVLLLQYAYPIFIFSYSGTFNHCITTQLLTAIASWLNSLYVYFVISFSFLDFLARIHIPD